MKKLIVVSAMLAVVLIASIVEIFYAKNVYAALTEKLDEAERLISSAGDHVDTEVINNKVAEIEDYWSDKEPTMMLLGNHNVIRVVGDKIISLKGMVKSDNEQDSYVTVLSLKKYIGQVEKDLIPIVSNIF